MMRWGFYIVCLVWMAGCGSSKPYVDNPYEAQVRDFTHAGVSAMHKAHWARAEQAFSRAVQMSELLSDPALEARSHYNLGMALKAEGKFQSADIQWQKAQDIAALYHLPVAEARARLQRLLLHPKSKQIAPEPSSSWSADMYLSLGRLDVLRKRPSDAVRAYQQVLQVAGEDKNGLLLRGRAMLALAKLDASAKSDWAEQALRVFRKVGAPKLTAQGLWFIARDDSRSHRQRLDSAQRARTIYRILKDKPHEIQAAHLVEALMKEQHE